MDLRSAVPLCARVIGAGWLAVALVACSDDTSAARVEPGGDATALAACVGPKPPAAAWSTQPGPTIDPATAATPTQTAPVLESAMPQFALTDQQPLSCGFKGTYGLPVFAGKATLVALLAGW